MTIRQKQIVQLLRHGMSNKEISVHLGISDNTVKMHLARLYIRHAVKTRAKLLAKLHPIVEQDR